ncbi:MAG: protein kinase [archaeon]|nr:protein kinase [archaeon]
MVSRNSFDYINIIGRGGFGKVWKVIEKKTNKLYAMKEMVKTKIIDKKSVQSVKNERRFLSRMNHPFIVNMHYAFQDNSNLYLVMDLLLGGDLRYQLCYHRKFNEIQSQFFIACILLSLEYIHSNNIIHRDIKPENLVLDSDGKLRLTDFGIAKPLQLESNAKDTSGTPGYMSPEVMCGQEHGIAVDYFALGVIGYEFMMGIRPYLGNSRKEIKEKIMARQVRIKKEEIPPGWSIAAVDCINKLLIRKPSKRLGYHGLKEIKNHPWFKDFNFGELYLGEMKSSFIPKGEDNYDFKYCNAVEKMGNNTRERYEEIIQGKDYLFIFDDYSYFSRQNYSSVINLNEENKFQNPHLIYEIQKDIEEEKKNKIKIKINSSEEGVNISHTAVEKNNKNYSKKYNFERINSLNKKNRSFFSEDNTQELIDKLSNDNKKCNEIKEDKSNTNDKNYLKDNLRHNKKGLSFNFFTNNKFNYTIKVKTKPYAQRTPSAISTNINSTNINSIK